MLSDLKMKKIEEVLERETYKIIINNNIDSSKVMFPEKLKAAKEMLGKYPPSAELRMRSYSKFEQEYGFEICGAFKNVDIETNTFFVEKMSGPYEIHFKIRTVSDTLNHLVKIYSGKTIKVQIRPRINAENQFEYELMSINEVVS